MGRRPAAPLRLRHGDRAVLEAVANGSEPAPARRAQMLLAAADGVSTSEIAKSVGTSQQSVGRWRARYSAEGIDCLSDRPRPGRPQVLEPTEIVARTLRVPTTKEALNGRWSARSLASTLGISGATVARAWAMHGVLPSHGGTLELPTRPAVTLRAGQILGLLVDGPLGLVAFAERAGGGEGAGMGEAVEPDQGARDGSGGDGPGSGPDGKGRPTVRWGTVRAGLEVARDISARLPAASELRGRAGTSHSLDDAVTTFLEQARRRGAVVIGTGAGIPGVGTALVDTFSAWRQIVETLAVAAAVAGDVDELRSLRDSLGHSDPEDGTVHWQHGTVSAPKPARATMREVAAMAGVSIKTVSNALTGAKPVAQSTGIRIDHAVQELGYQVNTAARQLRTGRHGALVLAVPELRLSYYAELAEQIIDEAERQHLSVLVQTTRGDLGRELKVIDSARRRADGLIIAAHALRHDTLSRLTTTGPIVVLGEAVHEIGADQITISNADAATTAMDHLLDGGRRRIALLGIASRAVAEARVRGCRASTDRHGVDLDPELMLPTSLWRRDEGERAMLELLDRGIPFDAVVGFNDELALGAQHALLARGVRVPEDVAVLGFDNSDSAVYSTPGLTSIAPAFDVIARTAVRLVTDRSAVEGTGNRPTQMIAPHRLVVRGSTG